MMERSILLIWEEYISLKNVSTAEHYRDAMKRLTKDMGRNMLLNDVNSQFIINWREKMKKAGLSKTTINIYLRSFAAVLHFVYERKQLSINPSFLFKGLGIYSKSSSNSRRDRYMSVEEWQQMWSFFENPSNNSIYLRWNGRIQKRVLEALGLMLFMYLANGMNLRDVCLLRYDAAYFSIHRKAFKFIRHKVAERTNAMVEIPVLRELNIIVNQLGNPAKTGHLVFPYLEKVSSEEEEYRKVALLGKKIRKWMKYVSSALLIYPIPTPTWARHSFATNLIQNGVPKDYVSWAMAHSDNDVTNTYIDAYSYKQMVEYNTLLLHNYNSQNRLLEQLYCLTANEFKDLMKAFYRYRQE